MIMRKLCVLLGLLVAAGCMPFHAAAAQEGVALPILMYHSVLKDPKRTGLYVVTPDRLREDLLYLKAKGYSTVTAADLMAYVQGGTLPEKPVMITFDDGHYNNLTYALPLLQELDMKAVVSVVGRYTKEYSDHPDPNPNYAYLSWADVSALADSGHVEIGSHSFDMHRQSPRMGSDRMRGEDEASYRAAFLADTRRLQDMLEEKCGFSPIVYAYPFGAVGRGTADMLRELGFACSLTCREKVNRIRRDPDSLFSLGRFNRPGDMTTEAFMEKLGVAISKTADIIVHNDSKAVMERVDGAGPFREHPAGERMWRTPSEVHSGAASLNLSRGRRVRPIQRPRRSVRPRGAA